MTKSVLLRIDQEANGDYTVELAAETGDAGWEHQPVVSARIPHDAEAPSPPVVDGQPLDGRSMREAFLAASEPSRVLKEIGEFLGALLFPPPVREAFDRLSQDDALRVMLEVRSPDLQRLPWELARDADAVLPLFLTNGMPWSRISPRRRVQASPAECWPLLRVLLVVGIDTDDEAADTIGAAREIRDVQDQLARYAGFVDVELLNRPSQDELRRTYNRLQPHVLHFVGHGTPGSEAGELLIHAKDGAPAWTWDAGRIAVDLQDWVPTLVLLNACRTVAVNEQNGAWEVIDAFLQLGAQAVIGMQGDVAGDTAARFARALYGALGENEPIDRSVARARAEIQGNGLNTREPWLPCLILNTLAGDVFPRRFALEVADCRHILDGARFNKIQAFVDRREERRALWGQLNGSGAGPAVVAVEGPEGCGKSAFVRWYIGSMALRGRNAAYLDISNGGTLDLLHFLGAVSEELALFPLQRAANQAAFDEWLVEVDRIQHRERGGPAAPAGGGRYDRQLEEGPETGPQEVLAAFVAAVARAAPREPLLLAVDGLASVDPGALSFLIAGLLEPIIEQRLPMQLILVAAEGGVSQLLNERRRLLDSVKSLRIGPIAHSEPASLMMQYLLARGLQRTGSLEELIELTFTSQPGHAGLNTALFAAAELLARNMQGAGVNVEEVLARVRDGEGFLAATQSLLSDPDAELLARLSIPRRLDRGVAEALTEDPQALERAIGLGAVEATGRGSYRLVPSIRDLHFARRWADPSGGPASAELVELSVRLTEYYTAHGDDVEALYHQFVFAPAAAFAHFLKLFEEADSRSDLARCRDLLEACGDRRSLLSGPNDSERWDSLRAHLDTRSYWIDDWYRSSRFLQPESTREPVAQLLADGPGGALQLYAQGGSGKSMHIRWLIARRCVADGIACARIDFDAVDLAAAIDEPWLIPLALAEQLNRQLRGAPFTAMLKEADFDPERLWRHIGFGDGPADHRFRPTQTSDITSEASRFAAELGALNSGERVLLVLDTLEAPLDPRWVPGGRELVGTVLAALGAAQRAAPNLHVLVAGRFDLRTVFDDFEQLLPNVQTHRLGGFTPDEADRYLRDRRHLESEAHIAAAIEGLTTGDGEIVPFKLALVADVIEHEPALKPEEIVAYSRHDLLYLIKRVVERIDPAVRWVLRYGVFPRILNLEFVREAMQPFLKEAMSQRVGDDDLSADELPGGMPTAEELWSSDLVTADGEVDIDTLWSRLCAYAGDASWVGFDHSAGQQVLRFHPDVVEPMRELVRDKGVAARLHRSAAEWFETQAARHSENPEYATRMLTEALYHRTQLDGAAVLGYWRARMASPIAVNNPDMRRQLARELISTAPSPPAVAEASLEYAWASAQAVAWRLGSLSGDAQAALDRATGLAIYLDPDRLTLVRAAVAIAGGEPPNAQTASAARYTAINR